jgi:hypothetical protein
MADGGAGRLVGVFLAVVVIVLAVTALLALVGGGSGQPDGANVDGQSPAAFQPENVNPEVDPETGDIEVDPETGDIEVNESGNKRILVDARHGNQITQSELEPVAEATFEAGHTVEFPTEGETSRQRSSGRAYNETLSRYDAVLVVQPTRAFTPEESRALQEYTDAGGRVVVLAEPTQTQLGTGFFAAATTVSFGANNLTAEYGVRVGSEMLYNIENAGNDNNFKSIYAVPSSDGPLTEGVETVSFDLGGYAVVDGDSDARVLLSAVEGTKGLDTRRDGEYPTVVRNGNMVFVSDSSFVKRSELYDVDNEVFVGNLVEFLVSGDLEDDFPDGTSESAPEPPEPPEPPTPTPPGPDTPTGPDTPPGTPTPTPEPPGE